MYPQDLYKKYSLIVGDYHKVQLTPWDELSTKSKIEFINIFFKLINAYIRFRKYAEEASIGLKKLYKDYSLIAGGYHKTRLTPWDDLYSKDKIMFASMFFKLVIVYKDLRKELA